MGHVRYSVQYPDLFTSLSDDEVWAVEQTLANGRLEGWRPDRFDVADLIDNVLGHLPLAAYVARGSARRALPTRG